LDFNIFLCTTPKQNPVGKDKILTATFFFGFVRLTHGKLLFWKLNVTLRSFFEKDKFLVNLLLNFGNSSSESESESEPDFDESESEPDFDESESEPDFDESESESEPLLFLETIALK